MGDRIEGGFGFSATPSICQMTRSNAVFLAATLAGSDYGHLTSKGEEVLARYRVGFPRMLSANAL
jgi:hypothetical protein